jgi:transketolase
MVVTQQEITYLEEIARKLRVQSLKLIHDRKAGHPGGALSAAEIISVLYFHTLNIDPKQPNKPFRDRFILSKGHASAILYSALALKGFFSISELANWGDVDCPHQGHPDRLKTPGVDMTSGILGHGIAVGAGMALAARQQKQSQRIYVLIGDGESQGGIIWEGAAVAAKFHLENLIVILDYNDVQLDGFVHDVMPIEPISDKWRAFNWNVLEINGHNIPEIIEALDAARKTTQKPTMIIAHTIKGKGVSFMENKSYWHGNVPNDEQLKQALEELGMEVPHV